MVMRCELGGRGAGGGLVGLCRRRAGVGRKSSRCGPPGAEPRLLARAPRLVVGAGSIWPAGLVGRLEREGTAGGDATGWLIEGTGGGRLRIDWSRGGGGPGPDTRLAEARASPSGPGLPLAACSWRRAALRACTLAGLPGASRPNRRKTR